MPDVIIGKNILYDLLRKGRASSIDLSKYNMNLDDIKITMIVVEDEREISYHETYTDFHSMMKTPTNVILTVTKGDVIDLLKYSVVSIPYNKGKPQDNILNVFSLRVI